MHGISRSKKIATQRSSYALLAAAILGLAAAEPALAQVSGSPAERLIAVLVDFVTGPLARGMALIALVLGGLTMAFAPEGFRHLGWLLFGVALAVGAVQMLAWLYGV